ncbi:MAG: hypothetical protein SVV03_02485 [Candidatus Nanohaloarchaea archaeon]|nr:hypothetical protein [Candidatus Nanohaloarchaea archaeon]
MTSHQDVANRLCGSDTEARQRPLSGTNMTYKPPTGDRPAAVMGYGRACYAVRIRDNMILFRDWEGYSVSTTQHLTILEKAARRHDLNIVYLNAKKQKVDSDRNRKGKSYNRGRNSYPHELSHGRPTIDKIESEWLSDKPEELGTATEGAEA